MDSLCYNVVCTVRVFLRMADTHSEEVHWMLSSHMLPPPLVPVCIYSIPIWCCRVCVSVDVSYECPLWVFQLICVFCCVPQSSSSLKPSYWPTTHSSLQRNSSLNFSLGTYVQRMCVCVHVCCLSAPLHTVLPDRWVFNLIMCTHMW